jgi:hypothetical protein
MMKTDGNTMENNGKQWKNDEKPWKTMENEEKRWKTMENGSLSRLAFDPPACSPFHSESEGRLGSSPWGLAAKAPIIPSLGSQRSHSGAMAVAFLWLCGENVEQSLGSQQPRHWSRLSSRAKLRHPRIQHGLIGEVSSPFFTIGLPLVS